LGDLFDSSDVAISAVDAGFESPDFRFRAEVAIVASLFSNAISESCL
jgi:hypothetical protein